MLLRGVCCVMAAVLAAMAFGTTVAFEPEKGDAIDFQKDVLPILEAKCNRCHGARSRRGELDLRTRELMLKGGVSGPAIVPGNSQKSLMIELIHFNEMPPKRAEPRITGEEFQLLKAWVDAGAPAPR